LTHRENWESGQGFARSGDFSRLHTSAFSAAQNSRPPLILRRPAAAQTSSPVGFFRADCPQKPNVPAKSPSCSLQPRPDSLPREWEVHSSSVVSRPFPLAFAQGKGWECFREERGSELQERWPEPVQMEDREPRAIVILLKSTRHSRASQKRAWPKKEIVYDIKEMRARQEDACPIGASWCAWDLEIGERKG